MVVQRNLALLALRQKRRPVKGSTRCWHAKVPEALLQDAALKLTRRILPGRGPRRRRFSGNPEEMRALSVLVGPIRRRSN